MFLKLNNVNNIEYENIDFIMMLLFKEVGYLESI